MEVYSSENTRELASVTVPSRIFDDSDRGAAAFLPPFNDK